MQQLSMIISKLDLGDSSATSSALQEQPIPQFPVHGPKGTDSAGRVLGATFPRTLPHAKLCPSHDIGLVGQHDLAPPLLSGIVKGELLQSAVIWFGRTIFTLTHPLHSA